MEKFKTLLLTILLVAAAGLSACGSTASQQPHSTPNAESTQQGEHGTAQDSASGVLDLNSDEVYNLVMKLSLLHNGDFFDYRTREIMEGAGYTLNFANLQRVDYDNITFDMVIGNKDGNSVNVPLRALLIYEENINEKELDLQNMNIYWGSVDVTDGQIVITNIDTVYAYNANTLEKIDIEFETPKAEGTYITNAAKVGDKYIASVWNGEKQGFVYLGSDGHFLGEYMFDINPARYAEENFVYDQSWRFEEYDTHRATNFPLEIKNKELAFLDDSENEIIRGVMDVDGFIYQLDSGNVYHTNCLMDTSLNSQAVKLYKIYSLPYYKEGCLALKLDDGKVVKKFFTDSYDISHAFEISTDNTTSLDSSADVLTINCAESQQKVVVDFNTETVTVSHEIAKETLGDVLEKSRDGALSLVETNRYGGGDISYRTVVAVDNRSGQIKYIADVGGMYGGGEEVGFFTNGDIYRFSHYDFVIHSRDLSQEAPIFTLTDKIPFGTWVSGENMEQYKLPDTVWGRYLFAARRDPQDDSFVIVYCETPKMENFSELLLENGLQTSVTYKVAQLDKEGNMLQSWDTGEKVIFTAFGLANVDMYEKSDGVMNLRAWIKNPEGEYFEGDFDIRNGTYTPIIKFGEGQ